LVSDQHAINTDAIGIFMLRQIKFSWTALSLKMSPNRQFRNVGN